MGLKIPRLDDTTFERLVKEARLLIGRYISRWTDHNVHDPGITFIELFAWLAELQMYHLDRITPDIYETFLKLVGITPSHARPASVDVTFNPNENKIYQITPGTPLFTTLGTERLFFSAADTVTLFPLELQSVQTVLQSQTIDNTAANGQDDMYFFPFGEAAPEGAELRMGFNTDFKDKEMLLTVDLKEDDLPLLEVGSAGVSSSVELAWEYRVGREWEPFPLTKDTTFSFNRSGRIGFTGPPAEAGENGRYWIRCRIDRGKYEIVPIVNRVLLNTVPALQVETVDGEILWQPPDREGGGGGDGDMPGFTAVLKKAPPGRGNLDIRVEGEDWEQVTDFELSGPGDRHYTFDPVNKKVTFGNGLNGRAIRKSLTVTATYKTTLGAGGNIPKGSTFYIPGYDDLQGTNRKDAAGGIDPETVKNAKARAKKDFNTTFRSVTSGDYERSALETPGVRVARAKAVTGYHPDYPCIPLPGTVTVVVVPVAREGVTPVPGEKFLRAVLRHLDRRRLVTTGVHVIPPQYVKVSVSCKVYLKKKSSPENVEKRVLKALEAFLDPLNGGPDKKGWDFGRSVYPSEIYRLIDDIEGVDYASGISFSTDEKQYDPGEPVNISPIALVFSGNHRVEVNR